MSEQANPKASKRSKRKPPMEPLGWDEIVSQPGMGGYLSFLNGPVALPHLAGAAPAIQPSPGVDMTTEDVAAPAVAETPVPVILPDTVIEAAPGSESNVDVIAPEVERPAAAETTPANPHANVKAPVVETDSVSEANPAAPTLRPKEAAFSAPVVESRPVVATVQSFPTAPGVDSSPRRPRIRRCLAAQDGHSLGEEVLYQALWKASQPEADDTRTITIGWRGMSQLCRMTPKNCKINTQRLLRKLALEILSPYNTPESIGTTYRVFSSDTILRRRQEAGFEWVIRSRGVEFVNPATGAALPMCAVTY